MNKEDLLRELRQAEEDIKLHDGGDSSFHYYEGLIDGLKIALGGSEE
jgi:hypothetical protein